MVTRRVPEDKKTRHYTISMPPDVMRLADETRGLIERSTWLRYLILKELGLILKQVGLETPLTKSMK